MSSENTGEILPKIRRVFKRTCEEAADLRIVEGFFSAVEKEQLPIPSVPAFDAGALKAALGRLKNYQTGDSADQIEDLLSRLGREMQNWRHELCARSGKIEIYHLRRLCTEMPHALDLQVVSALARFYRGLPPTPENQSRFDFAVTQMFTRPVGEIARQMRLERDDLEDELSELFDFWDDHQKTAENSPAVAEAVVKFDEFICEAEFLEDFEEFVQSNLFELLRNFKREVSGLLSAPPVTAAAIECNIIVSNVFGKLLAAAKPEFSVKQIADLDFAGLFGDLSSGSAISLFLQNDLETPHIVPNQSDAPENVPNLLQNISPEHQSAKSSVQPEKNDLTSLLTDLCAPQPDPALLEEYLRKYPALRLLNLKAFLNSTDEQQNRLCRQVLSILFRAEEIRHLVLADEKKLSDETRREIIRILTEAQNVSKKLRAILFALDEIERSDLLYVTNQLLEKRLILEHTVLNHGRQKPKHPKTEIIEIIVSAPSSTAAVLKKVVKHRTSRFLIAATFLAIVFSFGVQFFANNLKPSNLHSKETERIEAKNLPGGENLVIAYRHNETLFVTARNSWKLLGDREQHENLQELLAIPAKTRLTAVIMIDEQGQPVGNASPEQVQTLKDVQTPVIKE